jgi:O-antigen ligase
VAPYQSIKGSISLALTLLSGCLIFYFAHTADMPDKKIIKNGLIFGGILGFSLIGIELISNGYLTRLIWALMDKPLKRYGVSGTLVPMSVSHIIRPGLSVAALFFFPWSIQIYRTYSRFIAGSLICAAVIIIIFGGGSGAALALIVGSGAAVVTFFIKQRAIIVFSSIILIGVLITPSIPSWLPDPLVSGIKISYLPPSAIHRISIWQVTAKHIAERPILGHGFNSSRTFYDAKTKVVNTFFPTMPSHTWFNRSEPIPLHPHNIALQIWLELGLFGALLFAAVLITIIFECAKKSRDPLNRAASLGLLSSFFIVALLSFSAWQAWWLSALMLIGGSAIVILNEAFKAKNKLSEDKL